MREEHEVLSLWRHLLTAIRGGMLQAVAWVIALLLLESLLAAPSQRAWQALSTIGIIAQVANRLHLAGINAPNLRFDAGIYVALLGVLVPLAGVALGLYYTVLASVIGGAYARVGGDIRDLVLSDPVGQSYAKAIALLGASSALLFAAFVIGLHPGVLTLAFETGLAVIAILGFLQIGSRLFRLFDPTGPVVLLLANLLRQIEGATPDGYRWFDSSFQVAYQTRAERALDTYATVVTLAEREEHLRGRRLLSIVDNVLGLLRAYGPAKLQIPSDSQWFRRTERHPNWLTADDIALSPALATSTALPAELVPDLYWLERAVARMTVSSLRSLLGAGEARAAVELGVRVAQTAGVLGNQFAVDDGLRFLRAVRVPLLEHAHALDPEPTVLQGDELFEQLALDLALIDTPGLALVDLLLGLSQGLQTVTAESFQEGIARIRWRTPSTLYTTGLPRAVVRQLEYLARRLDFELRVEGHVISPPWYIQQLAALGFIDFLCAALVALLEELEVYFAPEAEVLIAEHRHFAATPLLLRGLEACSKFAYHLGELRSCYDRLQSLRRVSDIPWEVIDWEDASRHVERTRTRLLRALAIVLPRWTELPRSSRLPDYFGQAYSVLTQACYGAMIAGDAELFAALFVPCFNAAFEAKARLAKELAGQDQVAAVLLSSEPLVTLFHISGYALIYSELDGASYWQVAKRVWDHALAEQEDPAATVEWLCAIVTYRSSTPGYLTHGGHRLEWIRVLRQRLSDAGLLHESYGSPFLAGRSQDIQHSSPFIRSLARGSGLSLSYDADDVFFAMYLRAYLPEGSKALPRKASEFVRQVQREEASAPARQPAGERGAATGGMEDPAQAESESGEVQGAREYTDKTVDHAGGSDTNGSEEQHI